MDINELRQLNTRNVVQGTQDVYVYTTKHYYFGTNIARAYRNSDAYRKAFPKNDQIDGVSVEHLKSEENQKAGANALQVPNGILNSIGSEGGKVHDSGSVGSKIIREEI